MPEATPFTALGAGNGFPFCLSKIDVLATGVGLPFSKWTTLSGVSSDNPEPTQALIDESLILAMKLFWNTASVTASFSTRIESDSDSRTITATPAEVPVERVCVSSIGKVNNFSSSTSPFPDYELNFNFRPFAMYSGETFLGYGGGFSQKSPDTSNPLTTNSVFGADAKVGLGGAREIEAYFGGVTFVGDADATVSLTTLNGFHFVLVHTYVNTKDGDGTIIRDASADITGFDFYTYS